MSGIINLPLWAAFLVSFFLLGGSVLALIGSVGLLRLKNFYERVHAPTLGSTLGVGGILFASIVFFSLTRTRPAVHEIVIAVFLTATTPVTLLLLARAALHRDRAKGSPDVPGAITFVNGAVRLIGDRSIIMTPGRDGGPTVDHVELVAGLRRRIKAGEPLDAVREWIVSRKEAGIAQQAMYQAATEVLRDFKPDGEPDKYAAAQALANMISGHTSQNRRIWDTFVLE